MKNITVKRVGVLSIGKLIGTVNLIIGLAVGILGAIAGVISYLAYGVDGFLEGLFGSLAIVITAVLLYPLVLFALGWLYGVVFAFIFNVVIGVSGGVGLAVTEEKEEAPKKK